MERRNGSYWIILSLANHLIAYFIILCLLGHLGKLIQSIKIMNLLN